jgi:hypothetical protein
VKKGSHLLHLPTPALDLIVPYLTPLFYQPSTQLDSIPLLLLLLSSSASPKLLLPPFLHLLLQKAQSHLEYYFS